MASPELTDIITLLRSRPAVENPPVADMRKGFDVLASKFPLTPEFTFNRVDAGGVPAAWVKAPGVDSGRAILYLHGGGYVIGSIDTHRELAGRLSQAAAARVLIIEYRLAHEHPYPAAVEDAAAAYRWLLASGGATPARTVIAGDSAGGGLTVATMLALREAGDPLPAAGVCLSPWVDMEGIGDSMTGKANIDPMAGAHGGSLPGRRRPENTAGRAPLRRPERPAAVAHPRRHGRDPAGRRHPSLRTRQSGRGGRDSRVVERHDPCLASLRAAAA